MMSSFSGAARQDASTDRVRQKASALEHASYEVTRARRQYDAVDPANRLVAAELERRWNEALRMQLQIHGEWQTLQQRRQPALTDTAKREGCRGGPLRVWLRCPRHADP